MKDEWIKTKDQIFVAGAEMRESKKVQKIQNASKERVDEGCREEYSTNKPITFAKPVQNSTMY